MTLFEIRFFSGFLTTFELPEKNSAASAPKFTLYHRAEFRNGHFVMSGPSEPPSPSPPQMEGMQQEQQHREKQDLVGTGAHTRVPCLCSAQWGSTDFCDSPHIPQRSSERPPAQEQIGVLCGRAGGRMRLLRRESATRGMGCPPVEGGVGLGWVGSRPRLVAYPRSAPPSLRDPTGRPYPGVRSQGLPDC